MCCHKCCGMVVMVTFCWSSHRRCSVEASTAEDGALCPPQTNHHPPALLGDVWKPATAADQCRLSQHSKAKLFRLSQLADHWQIPGGNGGHREETRITTNHILVDHLLCPKVGSGSACIYKITYFSCWRFTNRWMPVLKYRHYTYKVNPSLHPLSITLQFVLCFQGRK